LLRSSFTGLQYAVQVSGVGTSDAVTITQTDFTNIMWGVRVNDFDNININRNNIVIEDDGYSNWYASGVYLNNSTGFLVEENDVSNIGLKTYTSGIQVINSGDADNRVYKNKLSNLTYGNQADRVNRKSDLNLHTGLQFLCNAYESNNIAISVNYNLEKNGIRYYQGEFNPKTSAGNIFQNNTMDIVNNTDSHFNNSNSIC